MKRRKRQPAVAAPESGRAFGYIRCSTNKQAESGLGLEAQERKIREAAQAMGLELGDRLYIDEAKSGGLYLAKRPAGNQLMTALKPGDTLIATKCDRVFRKGVDALRCMEAWGTQGVRLRLLDFYGMNMDLSSAIGRFIVGVLAMVGDLERSYASERTCLAMEELRSQGRAAGQAPAGKRQALVGGVQMFVPDWDYRKLSVHVANWHAGGMRRMDMRAHFVRTGIKNRWNTRNDKTDFSDWLLMRMNKLARANYDLWKTEAEMYGVELPELKIKETSTP